MGRKACQAFTWGEAIVAVPRGLGYLWTVRLYLFGPWGLDPTPSGSQTRAKPFLLVRAKAHGLVDLFGIVDLLGASKTIPPCKCKSRIFIYITTSHVPRNSQVLSHKINSNYLGDRPTKPVKKHVYHISNNIYIDLPTPKCLPVHHCSSKN